MKTAKKLAKLLSLLLAATTLLAMAPAASAQDTPAADLPALVEAEPASSLDEIAPQAVAPSISGPATMYLDVGYASTFSNAFTVSGSPEPTVTLSGDTANISWDAAAKSLRIAAGLAAGKYLVTLTAANGESPDATARFELTIGVPPTAYPTIMEGFYRTVRYRDKIQLTHNQPAGQAVTWSGTTRNIQVNQDGTIESLKSSNKTSVTLVTVTANGKTSLPCTVKVKLSPGQWLIVIFLFGWIWY